MSLSFDMEVSHFLNNSMTLFILNIIKTVVVLGNLQTKQKKTKF